MSGASSHRIGATLAPQAFDVSTVADRRVTLVDRRLLMIDTLTRDYQLSTVNPSSVEGRQSKFDPKVDVRRSTAYGRK